MTNISKIAMALGVMAGLGVAALPLASYATGEVPVKVKHYWFTFAAGPCRLKSSGNYIY